MRRGLAYGRFMLDDDRTVRPEFHGDMAMLAGWGCTAVRLEFSLMRGTAWDADTLSRYADAVHSSVPSGMEIIALVPLGAVAGASNRTFAGPGSSGQATRAMAAYAAACAVLAISLPVGITFELFNEPNAVGGPTYLPPSVLAEALTAGAAAIRAVAPHAPIALGGLLQHSINGQFTPTNAGADYLAHLRNALAQAQSGVTWGSVALHPYIDQPGRFDPAHLARYLGYIRAQTSAPLLVTEAAWSTAAVSEAEQASNLTAFYAACTAGGVGTACWFSLRDNPAAKLAFGLLRADGTAKPARDAFLKG